MPAGEKSGLIAKSDGFNVLLSYDVAFVFLRDIFVFGILSSRSGNFQSNLETSHVTTDIFESLLILALEFLLLSFSFFFEF